MFCMLRSGSCVVGCVHICFESSLRWTSVWRTLDCFRQWLLQTASFAIKSVSTEMTSLSTCHCYTIKHRNISQSLQHVPVHVRLLPIFGTTEAQLIIKDLVYCHSNHRVSPTPTSLSCDFNVIFVSQPDDEGGCSDTKCRRSGTFTGVILHWTCALLFAVNYLVGRQQITHKEPKHGAVGGVRSNTARRR